jgi:hypothetical protein
VKHKTVEVIAYQFDSLPGHIRVSGRGSGATLRVALQRAVGNLFNQPALRRKRVDSFKLSVVVIAERVVAESPVSVLNAAFEVLAHDARTMKPKGGAS